MQQGALKAGVPASPRAAVAHLGLRRRPFAAVHRQGRFLKHWKCVESSIFVAIPTAHWFDVVNVLGSMRRARISRMSDELSM